MIVFDYYKYDLYNLKGFVGCFFVGDEVKYKGGDYYSCVCKKLRKWGNDFLVLMLNYFVII